MALVPLHEPGIADNVGEEDGGQLAFHRTSCVVGLRQAYAIRRFEKNGLGCRGFA